MKNAFASDKKFPKTPRCPPMPAFQTTSDGDTQILILHGRLDPQSGKELKEAIDGLLEGREKTDLVIDLEHLVYMASAGFRELFMAGRKIDRAGGRLVVCSLQGEVKRVFELAGFDTAYKIFETREAAVAFLKS